ncbi:molybdate ABC transporter substrate-binding protein [Myxococcota bacterium]|nr:molybdate ABC transporter substrate-binding protein [Myxococcota bacterium]
MYELPPRVRPDRWRPGKSLIAGAAVGLLIGAAWVIAVVVGGRPPEVDHPGPIEVCADNTLREPLDAVWGEFAGREGREVRAEYGSTSVLADRYLQGMKCDVLISGDRKWVHGLAQVEALDESRSADVARSELVAAVREGSPRPGGMIDLAGPAFLRIGVGREATPLGEYVRAALQGTPEWNVLVPRFVKGKDPRDVRQLLSDGAVDVALTTRAEVESAPGLVVAFAFPSNLTGEVTYVAAVTGRSRRPRGAAAVVEFLARDEAAKGAFRSAYLVPAADAPPPPALAGSAGAG